MGNTQLSIDFSYPVLTTLTFVMLKLVGVIDWDWVWIFTPVYVFVIMTFICIIIIDIILKIHR